MGAALFGAIALVAAFVRAQADVKADTSGTTKLGSALMSQIKAAVAFK